MVGGESDDGPTTYLDTLFAYDEVSGPQPVFTELLPRLMVPRSYVVALAVPEDFVSCP